MLQKKALRNSKGNESTISNVLHNSTRRAVRSCTFYIVKNVKDKKEKEEIKLVDTIYQIQSCI